MDGIKSYVAKCHGTQDGDPEKDIPLAFPSGPDAYVRVKQSLELELELELKTLEEWGEAIKATDYDAVGRSELATGVPWSKS
ncbi:hypothetical protein B0A55_02252 [Friedmanniomyces simplex]|uniref:Uncharacterized protein n=1 Tax=Friedmanniomyces simplex TaxID=329884 RepID=A0A4U0XN83_9PEZI|nr:hypothetical protein B0A55_02252 [Friedmanniomyces simplex]